MLLWVLLLNVVSRITEVLTGQPAINPACLDVFRGAYRTELPFTGAITDGNSSGIIPKVFHDALSSCCRGEKNINYEYEFQTQDHVLHLIKNYSLHFIMPIQQDFKSKKYLHNPYVSIVESPGLAFYVVPSPSTGEAIVEAITSTWPLIAAMFMLVAISGCTFTIIEMITLSLKGHPQPAFNVGLWEGIWWSFVSMTTVGYGDICPKTRPGKVFSIMWVITGVACCALFTSYITTILTSACMQQDVSLTSTKVGVLGGSEEHRFAMKKNAMPEVYSTVKEVIDALEQDKVRGVLIDSYVAAEYQERLNKFQRQVIEHISSYGIVFLNEGVRFAPCIRDYIYSRQSLIWELIADSVQLLEMSGVSFAEERSKNLIDASSSGFYIPVILMVILLAFFICIGMLWDFFRRRKEAKGLEKTTQEEMSLTEWRCKYKYDLQSALQRMQTDSEEISDSCALLMTQLTNCNGIVSARRKDLT